MRHRNTGEWPQQDYKLPGVTIHSASIIVPLLLPSCVMVETRWCVFTGAPSSGKTTVLERFAARGYRCHREVARLCIEEELARGRRLEEIRGEEGSFQRSIIPKKLALEDRGSPAEITFWDRALPDSISYFRLAGLDPAELWPLCRLRHYARVFAFDPLPPVADYARVETVGSIWHLDEWLEEDYRELGYEVIRVPVSSISAREAFVMSCIEGL